MDVGTWLKSLGLGQYEAVFRDNEIDVDVLTELTDQHLRDLGVPLGHRLKILRAIRERQTAESKPHTLAARVRTDGGFGSSGLGYAAEMPSADSKPVTFPAIAP